MKDTINLVVLKIIAYLESITYLFELKFHRYQLFSRPPIHFTSKSWVFPLYFYDFYHTSKFLKFVI